jgi:hypothetical protein
MTARYLIRLDDACDTMDRLKWDRVEQVLDAHGVKPIVAVIPANRDPALMFESRNAAFWDKVRAWAGKEWSVALHGHTHVMHSTQGKLVLPFYQRSEFAGLALAAQCEKIRAAWNVFLSEGVEPRIWVAPAHSFDLLTLQAVRRETSIRVVSDGIAWDSFYEHDFHWIPQHAAIAALDRNLAGQFKARMTRVRDVNLRKRGKNAISRIYQAYFWWRWKNAMRAS